MALAIPFDNSYARLPDRFYARLDPKPVPDANLIRLNEPLARHLNLDPANLASPDGVALLAGNDVADGSEPLAMAYAGQQFGNWSPQLGDGRALLLGEVIDRDGTRHDIQLKGSGPTPFSRMGDGRAWLGPVLREYIVSEAMAALGIPTTRALAAVSTGENVIREAAFPGAVLTRVATSHVRVGTFQYFAIRQDTDGLKTLADYCIDRLYPKAREAPNRYAALLDYVVQAQAELVARWMNVGFIHGVMNTDNMTISGETIDYGPCAFMDDFSPGRVFSSIDEQGRYAYGNQPRIAQWNLVSLAQTFLPLLSDDNEAAVAEAQKIIDAFPDRYDQAFQAGLNAKLGLREIRDGDPELAQDLLAIMAQQSADFTNTFRALFHYDENRQDVQNHLKTSTELDDWLNKWQSRLKAEGGALKDSKEIMRQANPAFIPRNHRIEEVIAAGLKNDFEPLSNLLDVLARPYEDQPENTVYADPPQPEQVVQATFCGT